MGPVPNEGVVVGVNPWLPWPLGRSRWWAEPVRAERLAALRIALAVVLLLDLLLTYFPNLQVFYGEGSLAPPARPALDGLPAEPGPFDWWLQAPHWNWSLLKGVGDPLVFRRALAVWIVATVFMLVGLGTRLSTLVVWVLSLSFENLNTYNDNAGDQIRSITLLYLLLCPAGAAWSLDALIARRLARRGGRLGRWLGRPAGPVFVFPWALRLLVVQMAFVYFVNGVSKLFGESWRSGDSLYYVLNDVTIARWSYTQIEVPLALTRVLSWSVMTWEVGFPFFLMLPGLAAGFYRLLRISPSARGKVVISARQVRAVALFFGVAFHLGIFVCLELGAFGLYMICLYLPFVPWERWVGGGRRGETGHDSTAAVGFSART